MAYADTYTPDGFIRVDRVGARGTPVVGHDNLVPPACRRRARPRRYARTTSYRTPGHAREVGNLETPSWL